MQESTETIFEGVNWMFISNFCFVFNIFLLTLNEYNLQIHISSYTEYHSFCVIFNNHYDDYFPKVADWNWNFTENKLSQSDFVEKSY